MQTNNAPVWQRPACMAVHMRLTVYIVPRYDDIGVLLVPHLIILTL